MRIERLQIWNVATGQLQKTFKQPGNIVALAVAVSPDGAEFAAADADGTVKIVEIATGAEVHSFRTAKAETKRSLAYSPDGRLLASAGQDGTEIDLWDTLARRRSARLVGHTGFVYSVAFSRDGRLLASASYDRTVRIWDVAAARCVAVLTGHTDSVFTAVFHPDGKRLASGSRDRAVWLWDLATGEEVARLEGHADYVFSLAFSPDGRSLASGSGDGTVRLWDTEQPARRHQARREAEDLRPEAERLVAHLFAELREPDQVAARLRSNASLSGRSAHAAVRELLPGGSERCHRWTALRTVTDTRVPAWTEGAGGLGASGSCARPGRRRQCPTTTSSRSMPSTTTGPSPTWSCHSSTDPRSSRRSTARGRCRSTRSSASVGRRPTRVGLVHGDVKTANFLLENGARRVKIIDFGLAHAVERGGPVESGNWGLQALRHEARERRIIAKCETFH